MFDRAALGSDRSWRSWQRRARLAPFFSLIGVSFGFVAVVFAIGFESYFRLPAGVVDQDYVTLLRREADSGRSSPVRLDRVDDIVALAPEVGWAYAGPHRSTATVRRSDGTSEEVWSRYVSANYLEILGVDAALGQVAAVDGPTVAVISGSLWQRLYGSDADVVGRFLDTELFGPLPIVGVAAPGFRGLFFQEADAWILGSRAPVGSQSGTVTTFTLPVVLFGVIQDSTQSPALRSLFESYAFANTDMQHDRLELVDGVETRPDARRDVRERLAWLALVVVLLLLQVFLSMVDRLLAEHHSRREEQAVRLAVGATPADVFQAMVGAHAGWTLVVGAAAVLAGIYIADVLVSVEPFSLHIGEFSRGSLAWGFGASALLLLLALLLSGAYVSRVTSLTGRAISEASLQSGRALRLARVSLLFVAAASLLIVSSLAVRQAKHTRVLTGIANPDALMMGVIYYGDLSVAVDLMAANPEVVAFAQAEMLPLLAETIGPGNRALLPGRRGLESTVFYRNGVAPEYFDVLGVEVLAGRVFDGVANSEVVLAKTTAELLAGSVDDALGMALAYIPDTTAGRVGEPQVTTVVGVVEDIAYDPAYETPRRVFYQVVEDPGDGLFVVRDVGGGAEVVNQLQQHPDIEDAYRIGTVAEIFGELVLAQRSAEVVLALAAVLALTLAVAGVAFSLAKEMAGSSHAIGVRLALGATPRDITWRFCTRPSLELLLVVALIAAVALLGKLAAPGFMSFVELWLVFVVIPVLAAIVVLVVLWLASRMAKVGSTYSLLGAR
ncbi:MAG: ABC transporter permease [Gammaproteobacteria bacterium]|nr:ABC transporter permease [Gammaproteobacteria bacterium]